MDCTAKLYSGRLQKKKWTAKKIPRQAGEGQYLQPEDAQGASEIVLNQTGRKREKDNARLKSREFETVNGWRERLGREIVAGDGFPRKGGCWGKTLVGNKQKTEGPIKGKQYVKGETRENLFAFEKSMRAKEPTEKRRGGSVKNVVHKLRGYGQNYTFKDRHRECMGQGEEHGGVRQNSQWGETARFFFQGERN